MKLKNNTKNRNATANEIAKELIIDKLEIIFYYQDNSQYEENYSDKFLNEINKHLRKHSRSIRKRLNSNNDNIDIFF